MKKIYIFTAVLALLTLSLNAQLKARKNGTAVPPKSSTEQVDKEVTKPDGYFRMGPSRVSPDPVTPPYSNGFSSTEWDWWEVINANNDNNTWTYNSSGYAQYSYNASSAANDWLITAPVVLQAGKTYKFSINAWARSSSYPEKLEVKLASTNTATALSAGTTVIGETAISTTSNTNQLSNENVTVSTSGNYYFGIHCTSVANMWQLYVDNLVIDVEADPVHDLSVSLNAPATAGAGSTVTLTATVTNTGNYDENGYTVTFTANGTTISTQTGGTLAQGASATFTTTYTTDADAGTVNFGANVACTDDAEASNNNATASTELFILAPPENVNAAGSDQSGTMTWTAPTIESTVGTVTETFDDTDVFPTFGLGGITDTQHSGAFGDWTLYDPTGDDVYYYENQTFENQGEPAAWMPFNPTAASVSQTAHSGNQYMVSFCDANNSSGSFPPTNHWLISPELSGNAQTITFYERVITANYGAESYEVLVSSTDNDPASFTSIQNFSSSETTWTSRSVNLPAGTKYFAIRHYSTDIFGMLIDDVTYEGFISGPKPVSYNVYLDGQLVGNVDANTFSYTFNNVSDGEHECAVSAVYSLGESVAVPATFTIEPKTATPTLSMVDNGNGTYTITATAAAPDNDAEVTLNVTGQQPVTGTGSASITITQTNEGQNVAATATAQATGKLVSNEASENYTIPALPITPTPSITYVVNGDNVVITASGQGEVTLNVTGQQPVTGNGSVSITVPRTDQNYNVTATATAQANYHQVSATATEQITVPFLQTEKPSITYTTQGETVVITATATEPDTDAEVTLTVGNGEPVTGIGSVSVTVPCGVQSSSVTATATAQVNGKAQSETETAQITIPAGDGWTEMVGTYNNPNDLLSFQVKVGNDTTDIMLIDQFWAPTVHNDHPNGYTYVLKETIDGVEMASNPANVPVYKTNSNLNGFYTEAQVIADNKYDENKLTAHTLNTQIEYDVVPDNNVLYYSLYRGEKNEQRPVIDVDHRISQLQKFEDKVDGNVMYYFNENHQQGVLPKYEHIGSQTAERLDMNYVTGTGEDELSYVPVIWTFGLYTARGDGKNNSYGSDIKHSYVGKVNISVEGLKNDGDYTTGQWKDPNGTTYCVYSPIITLGGVTPDDGGANDGDTYQYVPYMYRVWCTYPNAHNFTLLANPDGKVHLADAGAITAPFLIGEVTAEDTEAWNGTGEEVKIGRALESGEAQQPWSFGVPVNESSSNVQFVARFYYKKVVTPGAQVNGLRGTRDNDEAAFAIAENSDDGEGIVTGINELADIVYVVSTTYVNAQGMQSDKPFDGLNIVVTRYSDGTTRTTKLVR